jgi:hypothetical protein
MYLGAVFNTEAALKEWLLVKMENTLLNDLFSM